MLFENRHADDEQPRVVNESTNLADLTDSEIIALSQAMNEESEAASIPLVSDPVSLDTVKAEYERGNLTFVKKIQALQDAGWKEIFRVKGDGDCFWRAFAFGWLLGLQATSDPSSSASAALARVHDLVPFMLEAGFQEIVFEDFLEVLTDELKGVKSSPPSEILKHFQDPETSNSIVIIERLFTSSWIRSRPDAFEGFLMSPEGLMLPVAEFCSSQIEASGREADHVAIIAISQALAVKIKIHYLDASGSGDVVDIVDFEPDSPTEGDPEIVVNLLFRPGHYDALSRAR